MTSNPFPTEPSKGDALRTVATAVISVLPLIGGPAAVLMERMASPLANRQSSWLNELASRLEEVERFKSTIDEISGNGSLVDAVVEAAQIAVKTASEEKRKALIECVVKSVDADSLKRADLLMTMWRIERMTEWHLRLLRLGNDPKTELKRLGRTYETGIMSSLVGLIRSAYPELSGNDDFILGVWRDLFADRLVNTGEIMSAMSASGAFDRRTTDMGKSIIFDCFGN